MERENNKLKFTLIWSSCICVLLLMVVLGISSSAKGTLAADACTCPYGGSLITTFKCFGDKFDVGQASVITGNAKDGKCQLKDAESGTYTCAYTATCPSSGGSTESDDPYVDTDGDCVGADCDNNEPEDAKIYIYLVGNGGAVGGDSYKYLECPNGSCSLPTADKDDIKFLGWSVGSKSCTSLLHSTYKTSNSGTKLYACWDDPAYAWFWTPAEGPEACLPYKEYFGKSGYTYIKKASSCSTGPGSGTPDPDPDPTPAPSSSSDPSSSKPSVSDPSDEEISSKPDDDNVSSNPQTGDIAIFVVWVIAAAAIVYSVWYFKKVREN